VKSKNSHRHLGNSILPHDLHNPLHMVRMPIRILVLPRNQYPSPHRNITTYRRVAHAKLVLTLNQDDRSSGILVRCNKLGDLGNPRLPRGSELGPIRAGSISKVANPSWESAGRGFGIDVSARTE
jgi:hypothetical protein